MAQGLMALTGMAGAAGAGAGAAGAGAELSADFLEITQSAEDLGKEGGAKEEGKKATTKEGSGSDEDSKDDDDDDDDDDEEDAKVVMTGTMAVRAMALKRKRKQEREMRARSKALASKKLSSIEQARLAQGLLKKRNIGDKAEQEKEIQREQV
jgi:hypothetical protein